MLSSSLRDIYRIYMQSKLIIINFPRSVACNLKLIRTALNVVVIE